MIDVESLCKAAKVGARALNAMTTWDKDAMITCIAESLNANVSKILAANKMDLDELPIANSAFRDRLTLTPDRIDAMREGLLKVVDLTDPIDEVVEKWSTPVGLNISKVRAPLGVVAVIYEARPNVTIDVVGLCLKTGNAVVLRGGADAIHSNRALYSVMVAALKANGFSTDMIQFIDEKDRQATLELLKQGKWVDVVIPRGGDKLKELVLANATMPVIASAGGNCHIYVHESASLDIAKKVLINAKVQRPTVCNAAEQLLIDKSIAATAVPILFKALQDNGVVIHGDEQSCALYAGIERAKDQEYYDEHLSLTISVKIVDNIDQAIEWINIHTTSHSDAIIAQNKAAQERFASEVDSGCVYINTSTRFTDGFEFGFGAEIGISTQKLHARGPLGLKQLTSEKYVISSNGVIRK